MKPRRFDLLEVVLIAALAAAAAWAIHEARAPFGEGASATSELAPLAARYGPDRKSEHGEEWIVRDFFADRRDGFFVDVGANHYMTFSNTWYLETALGWSGIAIEPLRDFESGYAAHRPRTRFRPFFVSNESNREATLYVQAKNSLVSSADKSFTTGRGGEAQALTVPTITLDDLLRSEKVERIDFMSMDIELWEPKALAGFDIERYKPALVCVEAHPDVRQELLDYFAAHRYRIVGKYLRSDTQNLYFTPLDK